MVTKLELGKKLILDLIEQSVAAYEQREELCNKLQNLEGKSQNEQNLHLQVIKRFLDKIVSIFCQFNLNFFASFCFLFFWRKGVRIFKKKS